MKRSEALRMIGAMAGSLFLPACIPGQNSGVTGGMVEYPSMSSRPIEAIPEAAPQAIPEAVTNLQFKSELPRADNTVPVFAPGSLWREGRYGINELQLTGEVNVVEAPADILQAYTSWQANRPVSQNFVMALYQGKQIAVAAELTNVPAAAFSNLSPIEWQPDAESFLNSGMHFDSVLAAATQRISNGTKIIKGETLVVPLTEFPDGRFLVATLDNNGQFITQSNGRIQVDTVYRGVVPASVRSSEHAFLRHGSALGGVNLQADHFYPTNSEIDFIYRSRMATEGELPFSCYIDTEFGPRTVYNSGNWISISRKAYDTMIMRVYIEETKQDSLWVIYRGHYDDWTTAVETTNGDNLLWGGPTERGVQATANLLIPAIKDKLDEVDIEIYQNGAGRVNLDSDEFMGVLERARTSEGLAQLSSDGSPSVAAFMKTIGRFVSNPGVLFALDTLDTIAGPVAKAVAYAFRSCVNEDKRECLEAAFFCSSPFAAKNPNENQIMHDLIERGSLETSLAEKTGEPFFLVLTISPQAGCVGIQELAWLKTNNNPDLLLVQPSGMGPVKFVDSEANIKRELRLDEAIAISHLPDSPTCLEIGDNNHQFLFWIDPESRKFYTRYLGSFV